jgi:hypothetical protein
MIWIVIIILCYLIGSFPSGYLVGKSQGIDIRQHGSGNIGATNVLRVMGKKWGYLVFLCDSLKGFLAVKVGVWLGASAAADITLAGRILYLEIRFPSLHLCGAQLARGGTSLISLGRPRELLGAAYLLSYRGGASSLEAPLKYRSFASWKRKSL